MVFFVSLSCLFYNSNHYSVCDVLGSNELVESLSQDDCDLIDAPDFEGDAQTASDDDTDDTPVFEGDAQNEHLNEKQENQNQPINREKNDDNKRNSNEVDGSKSDKNEKSASGKTIAMVHLELYASIVSPKTYMFRFY